MADEIENVDPVAESRDQPIQTQRLVLARDLDLDASQMFARAGDLSLDVDRRQALALEVARRRDRDQRPQLAPGPQGDRAPFVAVAET